MLEKCAEIPNIATNVRDYLHRNGAPLRARVRFGESEADELSTLEKVLRRATNLLVSIESVADAIEFATDNVALATLLRSWAKL